ncbi:MAG TPA: hypothetical protein VFS76_17350, partial [Pyrinomonadaceae bacterium]|nr:hypothetical protein [Pyrinomonadaceae bacterium]
RALPKRLEVKIQFLSFGDGTGYVGSGATALPNATPEAGGPDLAGKLFTTAVMDRDAKPVSLCAGCRVSAVMHRRDTERAENF